MDAQVLERDMSIATLGDAVDSSLAIGLSRAEIDTQIATARRFPRAFSKVASSILSLATLDEETAEESMYALPRGGKPIQGPSIRFAEIVKTSYGNCRAAARVVHVDRVEKVVIAEGVFHDLETNTATRAEVRRRIVDRQGRIYKDDMIIVTGNAACSIALRNAILGGVPKALWRKAYEAVQHTIAGDVTTLAVTRDKAIKALANFGVTPDQVFQALGVNGIEDITIQHVPTLRGMFATLKNGEATVEEMFVGTVPNKASGHEKVADPLSDADPKQNTNSSQDLSSPIPEADTPAADDIPLPSAAGNQSLAKATEGKAGMAGDDVPVRRSTAGTGLRVGEASADLPATSEITDVTAGETAPSLPQGWSIAYAGALRRAQKKESLEKFAKQFWELYGGWPAHKDGPDGDTAAAIFNVFRDNFGRKEIIEAQLNELL